MQLFGFEFKRKTQLDNDTESFAPPTNDDGAVTVATTSTATGGAYGTVLDLDGTVRSEADLITKYREISQQPEVDSAIDEIVNEAITLDDDHDVVDIALDDVSVNENIKRAISEEFTTILKLLEFKNNPYDVFRRWYVDGRLYYHVIVDEQNTGIKELRYLDPRKIRKVREVKKVPIQNRPGMQTDATLVKTVSEYYVYNDRGFTSKSVQNGSTYQPAGATAGIKIARDSIVLVSSGLTDPNGTLVLSHMQKCIRECNQLRTLENAAIIYRLSRAPERRIWYVDIGNLPKMKGEQYLKDIMAKHKNRLVYDSASGEIRDDRKYMTMLEDFWLPRREGGRGTEVTTLPGGQNLGEMDDVLYFQKQLYRSLNVPVTRLDSEAMFDIGRATQISRDEIKFAKFIDRLRTKFSRLFLNILEKQLVLKGICTYDDWLEMKDKIQFRFARDNYFAELKEAEVINNRLGVMEAIAPYIGRAYSWKWVRKNILRQDDEEIEQMDIEIAEELLNPQFSPMVLNPDAEQFSEQPNLPPMQEQQ